MLHALSKVQYELFPHFYKIIVQCKIYLSSNSYQDFSYTHNGQMDKDYYPGVKAVWHECGENGQLSSQLLDS